MEAEQVIEATAVEEDQILMPFYIVCDVSYSMEREMPALNSALQGLWDAIIREPTVDDVARISLITFSDSATVAVPLRQASETRPPTLRADSGTNYGAAFRALAQTIDRDRNVLKPQGYKIFRPCAFFLTDGEPLDPDWARTFKDQLTYEKNARTGNRNHPIFVPFGFRDASEDMMKQLAYPPERGRWYYARSASPKDALDGIINVIMHTVQTTSMTAPTPQPRLQLSPPGPQSGVASGPSEYDEDFIT